MSNKQCDILVLNVAPNTAKSGKTQGAFVAGVRVKKRRVEIIG